MSALTAADYALVFFIRIGMAHGDNSVDAGIAQIDKGAAERHRLGAYRHAAEISVEIDAGKDFPRPRAQRRADLLPVVAVALANGVGGSLDQSAIRLAQRLSLGAHLDNSFNPSLISCAVSAPSPALRLAAEMAAAACGWP